MEVWKTPGHTQHDLTVLVHNVAGYGTMAITGDLIPNEALIAQKVGGIFEMKQQILFYTIYNIDNGLKEKYRGSQYNFKSQYSKIDYGAFTNPN